MRILYLALNRYKILFLSYRRVAPVLNLKPIVNMHFLVDIFALYKK